MKKLASGWKYDVVSVGYPGPVVHNRPMAEPHNLGNGWMGFDFAAAFKLPARVVNDAAIQALGSIGAAECCSLVLGPDSGSTLIVDDVMEPMELAHLPYKKRTYEDYVGIRGLEEFGKREWRKHVEDVVELLVAAFEPDDVVLRGRQRQEMKELPPLCRLGGTPTHSRAGFRMWEGCR